MEGGCAFTSVSRSGPRWPACPSASSSPYALARWSFPGKQILNGLVHLPLILPPVVTGYLLLLLLGTRGPIGGILADWGIVFAFRWTGAAVAAAVMAFPLMVRAIRLSIEAVDPKLEQASATLGASPGWVFLDRDPANGVAGDRRGQAILAFAKAMGEFGATITFVSNIPGQTPHHPVRDLRFPSGAGRRGVGDEAGDRLDRGRHGRAVPVRTDRAARGGTRGGARDAGRIAAA